MIDFEPPQEPAEPPPPPGNTFNNAGDIPTSEETGPPTHVHWVDGGAQLVTLDGYSEDNPDLEELPAGVDLEFIKVDGETRTIDADLERAREIKWAEVKAYRDAVRHGGFLSAKGVMDSDLESQAKIHAAVTMVMVMGPAFPTIDWTMADNTVAQFTGPEIMAAGIASGVHDATCHALGQQLRDQINDPANTLADILAIDPAAAPWPTLTPPL